MDEQVGEQHDRKFANIARNIRTGSPTPNSRGKNDDLESRNFTLQEEVKDLRIQLGGKQNDINKIQELLNKRTAELDKTKNEFDEKMKKMRGIFNGANKTLMELRQTVASKDSEIEELKATIESMKEKYEEAKNIVDESKKSTEKLTTEMHSQSATYNAQIEQLESKLRQSNQQIVQVKEEFQQYKTRAHALLEQKNSRGENDTEILELVAANKKLESELIFKSSELKYAQDKLKVAERDLKRAYELNTQLENDFEKAQRAAKENSDTVKSIQKQLDNLTEDNEHLKAALKETEARYLANVEDFEDRLKNAIEAKEKNLKQKQEENEALQKISEQLGEELSQVRLELSQRNEQIEELKKQISGKTQVASISAVKNVIKNDSSRSSSPLSFTSRNSNTLSDLLADMEERTSNVSDKDKDNTFKLQHMAEMLNESEAQVQKLLDQEKILKEEIRKLDRLEKRQNLSVEYLKNVVLKFFETEPSGREPLVPGLESYR
ncbi:uncharacterized protein OCT59_006347 [Rhizophagus irregularis]|uniref:uncharacterized protein n=1 Tax=Rhizophagus irregularis TaxID=588596 RepID=UPI001C1513DF|nr:hypothetical protein OCT59_006347 [Rhizophagus irregularis]CAB4480118.1 unnamed protein product [Rhizophagus irregularis]CAB5104000.1 unnamed protein product [Rhizophagus irregularis]